MLRSHSRLLAAFTAAAFAVPALAQSPLYSVPLPWASNNGGTASGVVFFDLNPSVAVLINAFDCNLTSTASTAVALEVYTTPGGYSGNETNPAAWTLVATDTGGVIAAGRDQPTHFTLTSPLLLNPGNVGIGFRVVGGGQAYTGTGTGGVQTVVSNNELTLTAGSAISALFTGTFFSIRTWNGAIYYNPAAGLYPAFRGTPTTGASPLAVQFTDLSYSSDPTGVLAWQWDLDGDGVVDSAAQNPTFTYTNCGSYNVSLTAIDATHGPVTITKPNYIVTDDLRASFTTQNMGGGVFQFTDTSTPTPAAWTWDFDGDSVIDSTLQNPTWTYPATCATNQITLTAYLNCRVATATDHAFVAPASLTAVPFTGGTGTTSASVVGNMFDVSVTAPEGISVCAVTQAVYTYAGPFHVDVYITDGSYLGKDTNIANWRLVASGNGVSAGGTAAAPSRNDVPLNNSFYLPAGNYGMVVFLSVLPSGTMYVCYTAGSAANWGPFSNADLTINPSPTTAPGVAKYNLFGTGANSPREWNGTLHYTKVSLSNTGGHGFFGPGCAGSLPVSNLTATSAPQVGQTLSVTANNVPLNAAIGVLGLSRTTSAFGPLPLDLTPLGAPGCSARVSLDAKMLLLGAGNSVTWNLGLPNLASLLGVRANQQLLVLDTTNALGFVMSDAAGFVIGL